MSRSLIWTSLMAGAVLLSACSSPTPPPAQARRVASHAATPITLAQAEAPAGYHFIQAPQASSATLRGQITEISPLQVSRPARLGEAPRAQPPATDSDGGGQVSALR